MHKKKFKTKRTLDLGKKTFWDLVKAFKLPFEKVNFIQFVFFLFPFTMSFGNTETKNKPIEMKHFKI